MKVIVVLFTLLISFSPFASHAFPVNPNRHIADSIAKLPVLPGLPYSDDFDSGNLLWFPVSMTGSAWELGMPLSGQTTGTHSGPNAWDVSLGVPYVNNTECHLYSPVFDFTGYNNAELSFHINYNIEAGWDGARMDVSVNQGLTWQVLGSMNDPLTTNWYTTNVVASSALPGWSGNSNGWIKSTCIMAGYSGYSDVRLRFVFTSDGVVSYDGFSLDDFSILIPADYDLSVDSIALKSYASSSVPQPVDIYIYNKGLQAVSNYGVIIKVSNVATDTLYSANSISPGNSAIISDSILFPPGDFSICAELYYPPDTVLSNNSYCTIAEGVVSFSIPYFNDFENNINGWKDSLRTLNTLWQHGTPAFGLTTNAYSGSKCWDINLTASYDLNSTAYLYTPIFNIPSGNVPFRIGFYHNYFINKNYDGVKVQYDLNGSNIWIDAGDFQDVFGLNWYNDSSQTGNGQFSGNSLGWYQSTLNLYISGDVRFRFVFSATNAFPKDGYSMDDFSIIPVPLHDLALSQISNGVGSAGSQSTPLVEIKNLGQASQNGYSVQYSVNGMPQGTLVATGSVFPGQPVTLALPSFTVPTTSYDICAHVSLPADGDHYNDTLCITESPIVSIALPYFDDFDGQQLWTVTTLGDTSTSWQSGYPNFGSTTGAHSGNTCWDINLYSGYTANANTILTSPYFDLSTVIADTLYFYNKFNTENNWDGVRVEYDINNNENWTVLGAFNDLKGVNWYTHQTLNSSFQPGWSGMSAGWVLSRYPLDLLGSAAVVQFRFVFTSDGSINGDGFSIDDFGVSIKADYDIYMQAVTSPAGSVTAWVGTDVEIIVKNTGQQQSGQFDIYYSFNGAPAVIQNYVGAITPGSTVNINLGNIIPVSGWNNLKIYCNMGNDQNRFNDTIVHDFIAYAAYNLPYSNNFDVTNNDWLVMPSSPGSMWEWGLPSFGSTGTTHSGAACWDVNLAAPYGNAAHTALLSPIFNYSNITQSGVSFWINYNTEYGSDGVKIEYSFDDANWMSLGTYNDVNGTNWYNEAVVSAFGGLPAWTGSSSGWKQVSYASSILDGNSFVRFRLLFRSDISISGDGVSIDDFSISGVVNIDEEKGLSFSMYPNPAMDFVYIYSETTKLHQVEIYDLQGRKIATAPFQNHVLNRIDIANLTPGIYLVKFTSEGSAVSKKLIISAIGE